MGKALDVATVCFWEHGYGGTSVRHLCEAMSIQPGSFYAAFGSKDECFRLAVERYLAEQGVPAEPGPDAIRQWLAAITDPARTPRGCLLVGAAVEHATLEPRSQALISAKLQSMEDFFWLCLRERPQAREDAALLAAAVAGIHVIARAGASPERLRRVAERALSSLDI